MPVVSLLCAPLWQRMHGSQHGVAVGAASRLGLVAAVPLAEIANDKALCQHFPGCMSTCSATVHAYRCQDCASVACHGIKTGRFVGIGVLVVCYNLIHQPVGACGHVWCQGGAVYPVSTCAASHAGVCCNSPCHTGLVLCCSQHLKCIAGCLIPVGVANMEIEAINELW